jgi:hypothetical protein
MVHRIQLFERHHSQESVPVNRTSLARYVLLDFLMRIDPFSGLALLPTLATMLIGQPGERMCLSEAHCIWGSCNFPEANWTRID